MAHSSLQTPGAATSTPLLAADGGAPPLRGAGHRRRESELDLIADVRTLQPPEQQNFVAPRRAHIESQVEALESELAAHPPNSSRWKPVSDTVFGSIDRIGMAAAYGVLWLRGYRSREWANLPVGTLHALHGLCPHAPLPPLAICSGLGSSSTDYVALLLRLWGTFRSITVIELPGHGYTAATSCPLTAASVRDAYRVVLDDLSSQGPIIVVGHSLGGRVALDYVTGCGRNLNGTMTASPSQSQSGSASQSGALAANAGNASSSGGVTVGGGVGGTTAATVMSAPGAGSSSATGIASGAGGQVQSKSDSDYRAVVRHGGGADALTDLDAVAAEAAATLTHQAQPASGSDPTRTALAAAAPLSAPPPQAVAATSAAAAPCPQTESQPFFTSEAIAQHMQQRVAALVLVAAMGAPFSPADLGRLFSIYSVQHYSQGEYAVANVGRSQRLMRLQSTLKLTDYAAFSRFHSSLLTGLLA